MVVVWGVPSSLLRCSRSLLPQYERGYQSFELLFQLRHQRSFLWGCPATESKEEHELEHRPNRLTFRRHLLGQNSPSSAWDDAVNRPLVN